ncbi:MAG: class II aldolase/adducin family protein [Candidatus Omnitrophica bacterium]|nr:class II aldolase/adducin family protein [Candidatus Omnitrophota bacterium]
MAQNRLPFEILRVPGPPAGDPRLKELIRWGSVFHEMGLAPSYGKGSHGNLSVRSPAGCLITATQTFLGELEESDFVEITGCDFSVSPPVVSVRGKGRPSTDSLIHWSIYLWRPQTACILHAHDPLTLRYAEDLGFLQTVRPADAGSPELVDLIRPLAPEDYFLVRDHGFVASGATVFQAAQVALSAHKRARGFHSKAAVQRGD